MKGSHTSAPARFPRLFMAITILVPLGLLIALEILLRMFSYDGDLRLVITRRMGGREYYALNRSVARRYFVQKGIVVPELTEDFFEIKKSPKTIRVFCLGESTMAGFPYEFNATAPSFIHDRLQTLLPQYHIEVINVGLSAVGSYVVADFIEELMNYEPDLFIVYVGHNEFYGAYGAGSSVAASGGPALTRLTLMLLRFKTFLLLRDFYEWIRQSISPASLPRDATLMQQVVGNRIIPFGGSVYAAGKEVFVRNLNRIIATARSGGVPILFSALVDNIRTEVPFESLFAPGTSDEQKKLWTGLVSNGDSLEAVGRTEDAVQRYRSAMLLDTANAMGFYKLGTGLFRLRHYDEANTVLRRARDLDALRFRASEEFHTVLLDVCSRQGVPVARTDSAFAAASPGGIIGNELILEHLHPNIAGYFLMAKTITTAIARNNLLVPGEWRWSADLSDSAYMDLSAVSDFDRIEGDIKVAVLSHRWPFVKTATPFAYVPSTPVEKIASLYTQIKINWSEARYRLASYYAGTRDFDRARKECRAVAKVLPFSYQPLLQIADFYRMEGKDKEARDAYLHCIAVEDNPFARMKVAIILLEEERAQEAERQLDSTIVIDSRFPDKLPLPAASTVRYLQAVAYGKQGKLALAKEALQRALAIQPDNPEAKDLLKQIR